MARYTITEIAKLCGTSPATVSRVLNNPDLVAELTGIDENTHVEVDEADRETSQTPSGMAPEAAGMGRDEDAIGGSKGAFFATMMVSGWRKDLNAGTSEK